MEFVKRAELEEGLYILVFLGEEEEKEKTFACMHAFIMHVIS
jgi:hypothetical protein